MVSFQALSSGPESFQGRCESRRQLALWVFPKSHHVIRHPLPGHQSHFSYFGKSWEGLFLAELEEKAPSPRPLL